MTTTDCNGAPHISRRKLRGLIITMGSERQAHMEELFQQPAMAEHFDTPQFNPGIPSRSLRSRIEFLKIAHEAGLVPDDEWKAIEAAKDNPELQQHPERFFECLQDIPVTTGRRGSEYDVKLHYSVELWVKARGINRGRSILACTLAHLLAMKRCVEEGFDFILEDNVRAPPEDCARRIWETVEASHEWERRQRDGDRCHLRYYGWLGSTTNIKWVLESHAEKTKFRENRDSAASVFPFPLSQDIDSDIEDGDEEKPTEEGTHNGSTSTMHQKPGGTPIWGAYAYWISLKGFECLMNTLRNDVGALLWKGKRMRCYIAKPIDKIMPRQIIASLGRQCVHVTTHPSFFRAPMLTSKIHAKWDMDFCRSTGCQLEHIETQWSNLWLTESETEIVKYYDETGTWVCIAELRGKENGDLRKVS